MEIISGTFGWVDFSDGKTVICWFLASEKEERT